MLVALDTPYAAADAADLRLTLGLDDQPALHEVDLAGLPETRLRLRLLGASHQVVLDTPAGRISETVACLATEGAVALPGSFDGAVAGRRYRFRAEVVRSARGLLEAAAEASRADPYTLAGQFPGDPLALTIVRADLRTAPDRIRWRTWHTYPQTGDVVRTATVVAQP